MPLVVVHGGADPLVSLDDQLPFLESATSGTLSYGVGGRRAYGHADERNGVVADLFATG